MKTVDIICGKVFKVDGVEHLLSYQHKVLLSVFINKWLKSELPFVMTQKQMSEILGIEYKKLARDVGSLISYGIILAKKQKLDGDITPKFYYYGHPEIEVDGVKIEQNKGDIPNDSLHSIKKKTYYVYACQHNGTTVYVGRGTGQRLNHCTSGKSSCVGLNKLVSDGEAPNLQIKILYNGLTIEESKEKERTLIDSLRTLGHNLLNVV